MLRPKIYHGQHTIADINSNVGGRQFLPVNLYGKIMMSEAFYQRLREHL